MWQFGRLFSFSAIMALLVAFGSSEVLANKKKPKDKGPDLSKYPPAVDADYKAIKNQKELTGKLVTMDGTNVTIRVEYGHWEANPKYRAPKNGTGNPGSANNQQAQMWRTYNQIMQDKQRAATAKNPQEYQRAMMKVAQDMNRLQQEIMRMNQQGAKGGVKVDPNNQPFITVTSTKDYELPVSDKAVFRKLVLPFEYDDTGKPKTYSDKEKAELRGDDKSKPGYMAKIEDFQAGNEIKLTLSPPKAKPKEKDEPAVEEMPRPIVTMVVMTKDGTDPSVTGVPDRKKKK